jgi:hypothetical protein
LEKTQGFIREDFKIIRDIVNQQITDTEANMLNLVKKEHDDISIKILKLKQDIPSLQLYIHQNQNKDFKVNLRE